MNLYDLNGVVAERGWKEARRRETQFEESADRSLTSEQALKGSQRVPIRRFFSGEWVIESAKPVELLLSRGEEGIIAEINTLQLIANGNNVSEAVANLSQQLSHFYFYFSNISENQVTGLGRKLREIYLGQFTAQTVQAA